MKRKTLAAVLATEGAACVAAALAGLGGTSVLYASAFPFAQIGAGLRALSLSGDFGNVVALALYAAFCLLPALYMAVRAKRGRFIRADLLLALLSALMFWVMYLMVNPSDVVSLFGGIQDVEFGAAVLGGCAYSVIAGYVVLRFMKTCANGDARLLKGMGAFMALLCGVFVFCVCFAELSAFINSLKSLAEGNTFGDLTVSRAFLALRFVAASVPLCFDIAIALRARALTSALAQDDYGDDVPVEATRTAKLCTLSVTVTMLLQIGVNLLQLSFGDSLLASGYNVTLPLTSILFALLMLFLSRYFAKSGELKRDNDMFV